MAISIVSAVKFKKEIMKGRHDRETESCVVLALKVKRTKYRYSTSLILGTRWRWMMILMLRPPYPQETIPFPREVVNGWDPDLVWRCLEMRRSPKWIRSPVCPTLTLVQTRPTRSSREIFCPWRHFKWQNSFMARPKYIPEGILKTCWLFIVEDIYSTRRRIFSSSNGTKI